VVKNLCLRSSFLLFLLSISGLHVTCSPESSSPPKEKVIFQPVTFPEDFFFGTSSSAYQVEGTYDPELGTLPSNWERFEEMGGISGKQRNLRGSNFYELYPRDLSQHVALGLNAIRLGISWERVEPEPGRFRAEAISYYVEVVRLAHSLGLKVMVTFYHWVVPLWVSDPFLPPDDPRRDLLAFPVNEWLWEAFARFVSQVVPAIAPYVDLYSIVNEPWSVMSGAYVAGIFPGGQPVRLDLARNVAVNLIFMEKRAADVIRALDQSDADGDGKPALIGVALNAGEVYPATPGDPQDEKAARVFNYIYNDLFPRAWVRGELDVDWDGKLTPHTTVPEEGFYPELKGTLDFIGLNFYGPVYAFGFPTPHSFLNGLPLPYGVFGRLDWPVAESGIPIVPSAFLRTIKRFSQWGLPLIITENGASDCDDNQRGRYIVEHLYALGQALDMGIPILGYLHWSLTDNFEWVSGFRQCFGLEAVDFTTFARTLRPSARFYEQIARQRRIDEQLYRRAFEEGYAGDRTGRTFDDSLREILQEKNSSHPSIEPPH
jgi:beta-glucosidase